MYHFKVTTVRETVNTKLTYSGLTIFLIIHNYKVIEHRMRKFGGKIFCNFKIINMKLIYFGLIYELKKMKSINVKISWHFPTCVHIEHGKEEGKLFGWFVAPARRNVY